MCTANICRSPAGAQLLERALRRGGVTGVTVSSAGVAALPGARMCGRAAALILSDGFSDDPVDLAPGSEQAAHRSTRLTPEAALQADLIVTAARGHRSAILTQMPALKPKVFTVRQVGRIAGWLARPGGIISAARERADLLVSEGADADRLWWGRFPSGDPRLGVEPLPSALADRGAWLVTELDAARGYSLGSGETSQFAPLSAANAHPDDVVDPHECGAQWHLEAYRLLRAATSSLAESVIQTLAEPATESDDAQAPPEQPAVAGAPLAAAPDTTGGWPKRTGWHARRAGSRDAD